MIKLTDEDKAKLLKFARSIISTRITNKSDDDDDDENIELTNNPKCGCFVTLHNKGALRGCIGNIEPMKPLSQGIRDNAINSAFFDSRFQSLTKKELNDIRIEISVLSPPEPLIYNNYNELLEKLKPGIHGVILTRNWKSATFLPQVWEQIPDKENFLDHLCLKAGMESSCWKNLDTKIKIYTVEHFAEEGF
ncbi:MAG: AmmeMemoRadiSam system protein A [Desulfobacterales bacterium]|nr:AmmeMemoRadiSam system protein A [Desulfobacterales bacterium]